MHTKLFKTWTLFKTKCLLIGTCVIWFK